MSKSKDPRVFKPKEVETKLWAEDVGKGAEPIGIDPWRHRSADMSCVTCMWYVSKSYDLGRCRKHAPTMSGYPAVYTNDWCGDHKLDENKL